MVNTLSLVSRFQLLLVNAQLFMVSTLNFFPIMMGLHTIEDIVDTANSHNIILTNLPAHDPVLQKYLEVDDDEYWYFEEPEGNEDYFYGPDCALCGRLAGADEWPLYFNNERYTVVLMDDEEENGNLDGFLRCVCILLSVLP